METTSKGHLNTAKECEDPYEFKQIIDHIDKTKITDVKEIELLGMMEVFSGLMKATNFLMKIEED